MAVLALVVRDPRREHLLQRGETAGREHLRAQRVALELLEVGLQRIARSSASRRLSYVPRASDVGE